MSPFPAVDPPDGSAAVFQVVVACVVVLSLVGSAPAGAVGEQVDVVIVFDTSNSMAEDMDALVEELDAIPARVQAEELDARYALVTYGDSPTVEQGWTSDFDDVQSSLDGSTAGYVENASTALQEATAMDGRADAERVVILVTDEDDDDPPATRADAVESLSDVHFLSVSPDTPASSACDLHQEPCDSDSANELRGLADDAGGEWIDVDGEPTQIAAQAADVVETSSSESSTPDESPSAPSSSDPDDSSAAASVGGDIGWTDDLVLHDATANRTDVEVGEPVEYSVTVENPNWWTGAYEIQLSSGDVTIPRSDVRVDGGENRTVRVVQTFEEPGQYELIVDGQPGPTVNVTPPQPTAVETALRDDGTTLSVNVTSAEAGEPVSVPLANRSLFPDGSVSVERLNVTPDRDGDFSVRLDVAEAPPNGTAGLPTNVEPVAYLTVNSSRATGELAAMSIEHSPPTGPTAVYRYDGAGTGWLELDANGTNATLAVAPNGSSPSAFAVARHQPAITVTELSVETDAAVVGEPVTARAVLENAGLAEGSYEAALAVDGQVVTTSEVTLPANATRAVQLTFTPESAGQHTLEVGDAAAQTLTVESASTTTGTPTTTEDDSGSAATAGQPGFGAALALVGLLALIVLVRRRP